jgi:hypothetical protein
MLTSRSTGLPILAMLIAGLAGPSACFVPAPISGGTLLCRDDDECPDPLVCDLLTHTCSDGDQSALPSVVAASFEPAFASSGTVRLLITADETLSADVPPVLGFAGTALDLVAQPPDGSTQALLMTVDDDVDEGVYRLTSVRLSSQPGLGETSPVEEILVVDRTPPALSGLVVDDATPAIDGALFGDVAPHDVVTVHFSSSEPLVVDDLRLSLGARAIDDACLLDDEERLTFACTFDVEVGDDDGSVTLRVDAADRAGNAAALEGTLVLDTAAPTLLPVAALALVFAPGTRTLSTSATPGGDIEIVLTAAEDLAAPPTLALRFADDDDQVFALLSATGRTFRYGLTVQEAPVAVAVVVATLEDRVGHRRVDVPVDLAAPFATGIPVGAAVVTTCPTQGLACIDVDGDGAFAATAACASGTDCNDLQPLAYGGAAEIPGDGFDNDCLADGDSPIDETTGVFVAIDGDDSAAGTRAAPLRTIEAGAALASSSSLSAIFVAGTSIEVAATADPVVVDGVVGGLDRETWLPGGAPTRPIAGPASSGFIGALTVGAFVVALQGGNGSSIIASAGVLAAHGAGQLDVEGPDVVVVDWNGGRVNVGVAAVATHIVKPQFTFLDIDRAGALSGSAIVTGGALTGLDGGDADLVNVYVSGRAIPFGTLRLFHSTMEHLDTGDFNIRVQGVQKVELVGSLALGALDASLSIGTLAGATPLHVVSSGLAESGAGVRIEATGAAVSPTDVNACAFTGCAEAVDVTNGDPDRDPFDPRRLLEVSVSRDRSVDAIARGAPSSVLLDIDGDCRYADGSADVGPDEL